MPAATYVIPGNLVAALAPLDPAEPSLVTCPEAQLALAASGGGGRGGGSKGGGGSVGSGEIRGVGGLGLDLGLAAGCGLALSRGLALNLAAGASSGRQPLDQRTAFPSLGAVLGNALAAGLKGPRHPAFFSSASPNSSKGGGRGGGVRGVVLDGGFVPEWWSSSGAGGKHEPPLPSGGTRGEHAWGGQRADLSTAAPQRSGPPSPFGGGGASGGGSGGGSGSGGAVTAVVGVPCQLRVSKDQEKRMRNDGSLPSALRVAHFILRGSRARSLGVDGLACPESMALAPPPSECDI